MPTSVACSRPGISERLTGDRDELPGVAPCTERQLEHAERAGPHLAVRRRRGPEGPGAFTARAHRSEEHTSELQSRLHLVCRLLLEKKKKKNNSNIQPENISTHTQ